MLVIVNIYMNPNLKHAEFSGKLEKMETVLKNSRYDGIIVGGDVNCCHQAWTYTEWMERSHHGQTSKGNTLYAVMNRLGLSSVFSPERDNWTFQRKEHRSSIDVIFVNDSIKRKLVSQRIYDTGFSDHRLLKCTIDVSVGHDCISLFNNELFMQKWVHSQWSTTESLEEYASLWEMTDTTGNENELDTGTCEVSDGIQATGTRCSQGRMSQNEILGKYLIEKITHKLESEIHEVSAQSCTMKYLFRGRPYDAEVARSKRGVNKLRRLFQKENDIDLKGMYEDEYRRLRNSHVRLVKTRRIKNMERKIEQYGVWPVINIIKSRIRENVYEDREASEQIARNRADMLKNFSSAQIDPTYELTGLDGCDDVGWSDAFGPANELEVKAAWKKLNMKRTKFEGVLNEPLAKQIAFNTLGRFVELINLCLYYRYIPKKWKRNRLSLIPKKCGHKLRPISVQHPFGKVMEAVILARMHSMVKLDVQLMNQFAYLENRDISSLYMQMIDYIFKHRKEKCCVLCLDLKSAFDNVDRYEIIQKMKVLGYDQSIIGCVKTYLSQRETFHMKGDVQMRVESVKGVPQGSLLGPILFIIALMELAQWTNENARIFIYADDICVVMHQDSFEKLTALIDRTMQEISESALASGLEIAKEKTQIMLLDKEESMDEIAGLKINCSVKILGVILDNTISRKRYRAEICMKLKEAINYIRKLCKVGAVNVPEIVATTLISGFLNNKIWIPSSLFNLVATTVNFKNQLNSNEWKALRLIYPSFSDVDNNGCKLFLNDLTFCERKELEFIKWTMKNGKTWIKTGRQWCISDAAQDANRLDKVKEYLEERKTLCKVSWQESALPTSVFWPDPFIINRKRRAKILFRCKLAFKMIFNGYKRIFHGKLKNGICQRCDKAWSKTHVLIECQVYENMRRGLKIDGRWKKISTYQEVWESMIILDKIVFSFLRGVKNLVRGQ